MIYIVDHYNLIFFLTCEEISNLQYLSLYRLINFVEILVEVELYLTTC
jgi:hypothetical protein